MYELNKSRSVQPDYADVERDEKDRQGAAQDKSTDKREQATRRQEKLREKLDNALDLALEESFPASDAISVAQRPQSVYDKFDRQTR